MKEWLISKGFDLKEYPDGKYWVKFVGKDIIYQFSEDFSKFDYVEYGQVTNVDFDLKEEQK